MTEIDTDPDPITDSQYEAARQVLKPLIRWLWQTPTRGNQTNGMEIRATILCWIFMPDISDQTLTAVAEAGGWKKQSLGRWVDDFKRRFPGIRNTHQKADNALVGGTVF